MPVEPSDPLAGALVADRTAPLTAQLERYATGFFARFDHFGRGIGDGSSPLLDALTARWTLPDLLDGGIELFDLEGFAELSRAWSSRTGYFDAAFDADTPHIVPIDDAEPTPLDAREVRRIRPAPPAGAMRPVAPPRVMRFSGSDPGAPTLVEPVATPAPTSDRLDDRGSAAPSVAAPTPTAARPDARRGDPDRGRDDARSSAAVADRSSTARADRAPGDVRIDSAAQPPAPPPPGGGPGTDRPERARADTPRPAKPAADARVGTPPAAAARASARADIAQPASVADAPTAAGAERYPSPPDTAGPAPTTVERHAVGPEAGAQRAAAAPVDTALDRADPGATLRPASGAARAEPADAAPPGPAALPRAALARERWRAVDGQHISPYPAAMGRAGALDAGMVRFPEARARIGGRRPGVVAGPPSLDLMADGQGLTPASRGAERLIRALVERLVPTGADPVSSWLLPMLPTIGQSAEAVTPLLDGVLVTPLADGAAERSDATPRADRRAPLPDAVTGVGRPRADGRLAMPRIGRTFEPPTAAGAGSAPSIGLRSPALGGADAIYGGPLGEAGALVEPVADGAPADAAGPAPARTRSRPVPVERRGAAAPVAGDARPRVGEPPAPGRAVIGQPAPGGRAAVDAPRIPQPTPARTTTPGLTARPVERRTPPRDGARAWMLAALENPAGGDPRPTALFGGPGAVGAASRALAERLAVAMGEVPLLTPSPMAQTFGRLLDGAPDAAVVAPSADRVSDAPAEATRTPAAAGAPSAERAEAKPESAAITGQTGRAAAQWASRIGDRLVGSAAPVAGPAVAGVVARIEQRLIEGAPGLVDALRRFEAADEPVAGARAWRAVATEAGLDPQIAELIAPVADEPGPTGSGDRRSRAAAPGAAMTGATAPAAAMPGAAAPRSAAPIAAGTRLAADRAAAPAPSPAAPTRPGAARGPASAPAARAPIGPRPMAAAVSRHPLAASGPSVFEQRMGRLPGARAAGPAEQSRWVLDPAGRRWLVPLSAPAPSPATSTAAPSRPPARPAAPTPGDPPRSSYVARRQAAVLALAERIDAAMNPPAAEPGSMARVLSRLSPAHQRAWITSGFDLDRLPPTERAVIGAMIAPAAEQPEPSRASSSAPVTAGAAPAELPIASAARMMARSLSRPGALGAALSGLAGRIEARPDRALRRDGAPERPAVGSAAGDAAPREMAAADGMAEPGALVSAEGPGPRRARRHPVASSMDPAALLASGTSATESRLPARLARLWAAATGVEPAPSPAPAFEADTPRVVVEPGAGEASDSASSTGSDFGAGGSSGGARASLPGGRTAEAALRAFDRARAGDRTRASALGRPAVSGDIGQLLTTLGAESPGGQLFGDRGPVAITPPTAGRVFIETGSQAAGSQPLRSAGESPGRQVETNEQARHRNAEQIEGDMSPEELERLAEQVIERLRQEAEFDSARFGADEWD